MFCSKCGVPLPENAAFCPKCGDKVIELQAIAQRAPTDVVVNALAADMCSDISPNGKIGKQPNTEEVTYSTLFRYRSKLCFFLFGFPAIMSLLVAGLCGLPAIAITVCGLSVIPFCLGWFYFARSQGYKFKVSIGIAAYCVISFLLWVNVHRCFCEAIAK